MSGFKQCIINGIKEGLISESKGEELYKNFDEIRDFHQYRKNLTKPEAEKRAAEEAERKRIEAEAERLRKEEEEKEAALAAAKAEEERLAAEEAEAERQRIEAEQEAEKLKA